MNSRNQLPKQPCLVGTRNPCGSHSAAADFLRSRRTRGRPTRSRSRPTDLTRPRASPRSLDASRSAPGGAMRLSSGHFHKLSTGSWKRVFKSFP
jgi:hypothetical protein